ncbi:pseudouridine synthase [Porphyrobacter sp. ULC335]|uniref:pseudouridine synthase n=1 Tax=Porphyrobacter sp. ULC335 TaxID=2854260 RepID=UPI00221F89C8|nr:pseudouridine synthase [Porphyrobacter sp. ULC335]UYV15065.1 pseudouridine synthase [Porphyrobacter sp. ULC335]
MPTQPPRSENRPEGDRIAKLLARAGVASRREIERMIAEGRVALDGKVLDTPATILASLKGVTVDGNPVAAAEATRLFAFNKPTGLITAERDMAGRPTIYTALRNALPPGTPRLIPIGRLDLNTEGLLLLTNDGGLKRTMELPATAVPRTYRARAFGVVTQSQLEDLMDGVEIEGVRYGSIDANLERSSGRNLWIEITITEGKNREVRRVLEYLGLQVNRLIRTGYGPFNIGDLPRGQAVELTGKPVAHFLSEMTGTPIPRGGVKKADKVVIAAPEQTPRPPRPPARKGPSARPAPRPAPQVGGDAASSNRRKPADATERGPRKIPTAPPAARGGRETLTNAPRKGADGPRPPRSGAGARKRPAPTRNTPSRGPKK